MIISERLQNRLKRFRKVSLQGPIESFLHIWGHRHSSVDECELALRAVCKSCDEVGEYHDAEELWSAGMIVLEDHQHRVALAHQTRIRRAQNDRTWYRVGGMVVGGLLLCALVKS